MSELRPPFILIEDGTDQGILASLEELTSYVEAIDVRDGIFRVYDPAGRIIALRAVTDVSEVTAVATRPRYPIRPVGKSSGGQRLRRAGGRQRGRRRGSRRGGAADFHAPEPSVPGAAQPSRKMPARGNSRSRRRSIRRSMERLAEPRLRRS